jgi:alpha-L-rhamnosidase
VRYTPRERKHFEANVKTSHCVLWTLLTGAAGISLLASASVFAQSTQRAHVAVGAPRSLTTDRLVTPLGIDSPHPEFAWKLVDARDGAIQTAYEVQVASSPAKLAAGKADLWDSGHVRSDASIGVKYAGPALKPATRYFWRVLTWDKDEKPYPPSAVTWWETGLADAQGTVNWGNAQWIGYEDVEHRAVREADAAWIMHPSVEQYDGIGSDVRHEYRFAFSLDKNVKRAALYTTGQDTVSAWLNDAQVLTADPLPSYAQMPWKKYVRADVSSKLRSGANLLVIEVVTYAKPHGPKENLSAVPMNAALFIEFADGTTQVLKSSPNGWRAALNVEGNWHAATFDDASWTAAVPYIPTVNEFGAQEALGKPWQAGPVVALRREFSTTKSIRSARLYATALGAYEMHINGSRVADHILDPGWTDFREHVVYQAYDVTLMLKQGANAIATFLAPGWYTTPLMWFGQPFNYGITPTALRASLRVEYTDGTSQVIDSDDNWKGDDSPITLAEIYDGETRDARLEQPGWDRAGFAAAHWQAVELVKPIEPKFDAQYFEPIRAEKTLSAKAITSPKPGAYVYDFGQNLGGVPHLRVSGAAGTDVQVRFAEVLNTDGTLYVDNLRTAKATDHFILSGRGVEEFEPQFTFHGFRYAEITGLHTKPDKETLKAVVIHTDAPFTTKLETGSPMINQLWSNILWGQRSNFVGVPTDCPQRDERLGWAADAQVFWRAASYNMAIAPFSEKVAGDFRGTQLTTPMYGIFAPGTITPNYGYATGWSDAGVIIPWTSWLQTGDTRVIEQNWDGMSRYLAAIAVDNPNFLWQKNYGIPFGDWVAPEGATSEELIATAYWAYDLTLMREMAHATGRTGVEREYGAMFERVKTAFEKAYVHEDGSISGPDNNSKKLIETQTSYVLALHMRLVPESIRAAVAQRLVDRIAKNNWLLATGFLGTPYLLEVLTESGHADVAYRLLLNTQYPSWGYLVDKGATTMWERWNGDKMLDQPGMNSYNHYAYGAVADWIYRFAAGIDAAPADAGFHTIVLHPTFDARLGHLNFSYESPYGTITSNWKVSGNVATWQLTIPPNAVGQLSLPRLDAEDWREGNLRLTQIPTVAAINSQGSTFNFPAGSYTFTITLRTNEPR